MSETITAPAAEESVYPPLSEATENDVRELPVEGAPPSEGTAVTDASGDSDVSPTSPVAAEPTPEPELDQDEMQARNARLARELREQKRRARQWELEAQVLRGQRQEQPNEQIEREVQQRAAALAQQQALAEKSNAIYGEGVKQFGRVEFDQSVQSMNETFGQAMPVVIDTLVDLDAPQKLIKHLYDNPDVADQMALLPPHKLGAALAREAAKLNAPKPRPISKAPPPIRPIATTSSAEPETDMEKMSMDELAKLWDKRDFQRRMGF